MKKDILGHVIFPNRWVKFAKMRRGYIQWSNKYVGAVDHEKGRIYLWETEEPPEDKREISVVERTETKVLMLDQKPEG